MLIIPAIDLKDGQCVRLRQGEMGDSTVYGNDPLEMAARGVAEGGRRLHCQGLPRSADSNWRWYSLHGHH
jgi:phosphoribosylformimino-5-aminoimidazole carboxamide ribotide isomerase